MNILCLYHKSCIDGFASAYCVWRQYNKEQDNTTFIPVQYHESHPQFDNIYDFIFIVDFSFDGNKEILNYYQSHCDRLVVIDHHKTAEENLKDWEPKSGIKIFDTNHSGCVLTWQFLFTEPVPLFLQYIEDRDIWKWQLPKSKEFSAGLQLQHLYSEEGKELFTGFDSEIQLGEDSIEDYIDMGRTILAYQNKFVESLAQKAVFGVDEYGNKVAIINSPILQSEIGHYLVENNKDIQYAIIYFENLKDKLRVYSLRSRSDFDCSNIAKRKGGGGHAQACGYSVKLEDHYK